MSKKSIVSEKLISMQPINKENYLSYMVNSCACTYINIWPYLAIWQPWLALPSGNPASQFHYAFSLHLLISR